MSWSSFHFAVGMACSGTLAGVGCLMIRRGWRWIPLVMTIGGVWANVPDMPRLWRVDFPSLPFAATLGSMDLERYLHRIGDLFFFHHSLDVYRHNWALAGLILTIFFYNVCILHLLFLEYRARNSMANRLWRGHEGSLGKRGVLRLVQSGDGEKSPWNGIERRRSSRRSSHLSQSA